MRNKAFLFGTLEYNRQNSVRIIALPAANPFAGEYNGVYDNGTRAKLGQAKVDYTANTRHAFSVRYLYDNDDIVEDYELAENTALDFQDVSASWNWTLGQSMLNNAIVQYHGPGHPALPDHDRDTQVIRPSFTSGPFAQPAAGLPAPALHRQRHVLLVDRPPRDQVRRPHGDGGPRLPRRLLRRRACGSSTPTGRSTRPTATTWPTRFTLGSGPATRNYQNTEWGFFAQDDLRLGNLTLNLGLRYDFDSNLRSPDLIADLLADPQFAGPREHGDRRPRQRPQQPPAAPRLRLGRARRRPHGACAAASASTRAATGRGSTSAATWSATSSPPRSPIPTCCSSIPTRRAVLGGRTLEDYIRTAGGRASTCPATTSACRTSSAPRSASPRCCRATRRSRSTSFTRMQKDLQTGRDANLPARRARSPPTRGRTRSSRR